MSTLICSVNCPGDPIDLTNYQDLCLEDSDTIITDGFSGFALIDKSTDNPITDVTDLAQWQTLIDAGEAILGACGVLNFGTPSFNTSTEVEPCNTTTVIETVFQPTFHTYRLDPVNYEHCRYFSNLANAEKCWGIIFFDCNGNVIYNTKSRTGDIWFKFSIIQTPHFLTGDQGRQKWQTQFEIKQDGRYVMCTEPVEGLYDLFNA